MNNTIQEMIDRQSIRAYKDKEITKEDKDLIINAGINGPSAGNMQLYSIIDVKDKDTIEKLSVLCDNQPFIKNAKMVLVFCADYEKWYNAFNDLDLNPRLPGKGDLLLAIEDAMIVAQNTVNAAWSLGIGSCYIGDIMENYEEVTKLLELPDYVYPACMVVYGYIDENQTRKFKPKRVDNKYVVFENKYRSLNNEELKDMFESRNINEDYETWMKKFIERKYNSDFSKEMCRSANKYIERFSD
ncbi:MAG: nitroreductase family protein [Erysipelotrichaceae bacterium]|nr:nitroreductase family protein [Erysipelotrichaceae bacterium]